MKTMPKKPSLFGHRGRFITRGASYFPLEIAQWVPLVGFATGLTVA